jgi:multicomponent Na+:H+ antiporter subunit D
MSVAFLLEHSPALAIAVPLIAAFVAPLVGKLGRWVRNLWVIVSLAFTGFVAALLAQDVFAGNAHVYTLGASVPGLTSPGGFPIRIILVADAVSALFALVGIGISFLAAVYSWKFMAEEKGVDKFYTLLLLLSAAMAGLALTGDFFTLFVFLEISSIAAAGLIAYSRSGQSLEAAFKYIVISSVGAIFLLFGVGVLYGKYHLLNMAAIAGEIAVSYSFLDVAALSLIGSALLMKGGSFPVHMWKPDAYQQAPSQVTIMLLTAAMLSLYVLFRVCFTVFGPVLSNSLGWLVVVLGILSVFVGVTMAIPQHSLKRLIGYAAVAEIGYVLLGAGAGMISMPVPDAFSVQALSGGIFHMLNDVLDLSLIFLVAGAMLYVTRKEELNDISGLAHKSPLLAMMFMIGLLAISGMPPMNGFASKLLIYESVYYINPMLAIIGIVGSIMMLAIFVKLFASVFLGVPYKGTIRPLPLTMVFAMAVLVFFIFLFGLFPNAALDMVVTPAVNALIDTPAYMGGII